MMIEFNEDRHEYSIDNVVYPSVTQLISLYFGNKYERVNTQLLQQRSEYGSLVHQEIEEYFKFGNQPITTEARTFVEEVISKYKIGCVMSEKKIAIELDNRVVCCGCFDLLAYFDKTLVLVDFKTTSTIHLQEVILQLNLYAKGLKTLLEDMTDLSQLKLVVLQLKDNKYNLRELPRLSDEVIESRLRTMLSLYGSTRTI